MKRMLVLVATLLVVISASPPARSETTACTNITTLPAVIGASGI